MVFYHHASKSNKGTHQVLDMLYVRHRGEGSFLATGAERQNGTRGGYIGGVGETTHDVDVMCQSWLSCPLQSLYDVRSVCDLGHNRMLRMVTDGSLE